MAAATAETTRARKANFSFGLFILQILGLGNLWSPTLARPHGRSKEIVGEMSLERFKLRITTWQMVMDNSSRSCSLKHFRRGFGNINSTSDNMTSLANCQVTLLFAKHC